MAKKKPRRPAVTGNSLSDEEQAPPAFVDDDDPFAEILGDVPAKNPPASKPRPVAREESAPLTKTPPTHSYEEKKKLTKKDQAVLQEWQGRHRGKAVDAFFAEQANECRKRYGHTSVLTGDNIAKVLVGIPARASHDPEDESLGCLPFEYLISQSVFPLGHIMQLVSPPGVGKSGLLAEFFRWFWLADGGGELEENETKFNPDWYRSIIGPAFPGRFPVNRCDSVEEWQRRVTFGFAAVKKRMKGTKQKPGPGRTIPTIWGVDSIMGKLSEESQEKILGKVSEADADQRGEGEGAADRGWPVEALKITRYMGAIPQELDLWPFALVLVNHLKRQKDDMGHEVRTTTGGKKVNFQESYELELAKLGGHKNMIASARFMGYPVKISCEKNSFGDTHRYIHTRLLWWRERGEGRGNWQQKTIWDWDWSTVWLLNYLLGANGSKWQPQIHQSLHDMKLHLQCKGTADAAVENKAWSKTLGMKEGQEVSWYELGAMIRHQPDLMADLRDALYISNRPYLEGDYLAAMDREAEKLA